LVWRSSLKPSRWGSLCPRGLLVSIREKSLHVRSCWYFDMLP
jgi:hypothetical protein